MKRHLLPLFIQNRFSKDTAKSKLSINKVRNAYKHCKTFIESHTEFSSEYFPISKDGDNFVLLFVAEYDKNLNVRTLSPSNVMFCFEEDLETLYGPTLKGFVNTLQPGQKVAFKAPL